LKKMTPMPVKTQFIYSASLQHLDKTYRHLYY
jgi:hypothetical protein